MSPERKQRLDAIGFVWDQLDEQWEDGFSYLNIFRDREGHCFVPKRHKEGGYNLGLWVSTQRAAEAKMSPDRKQRLNAIGFVWDTLEKQWEEAFFHLQLFNAREGHCRVPQRYTEGHFKLGKWVSHIRDNQAKISLDRKMLLDEIGFVWDVLEDRWEEGFRSLTAFKSREGHCRIPNRHSENEFKLGFWVGNQRREKFEMSPERRQRLEALGFIWNPLADAWEEGFRKLEFFKAREGHCLVTRFFLEDGFKLGHWVHTQRKTQDQMSADRRQRLDAIGFVWSAK